MKVFGLTYLVMGLAFLLNQEYIRKIMKDAMKESAMFFYGGVISLVIGLFMVLTHNVWELTAVGLVTLFGWIALVKGLLMLWAPQSVEGLAKNMLKSGMYWLWAVVAFAIGLFFVYAGFFA